MAVYKNECIAFNKRSRGKLITTIEHELKAHDEKGDDCYSWETFEKWMMRNELGKRPITTAELKDVLKELYMAQ